MRRRSRPRVSPGRPLRFEYLCFAPRAACRRSAALQAVLDVRERCGAVRPARGAQEGCFSPGLSPAGGAAPDPCLGWPGFALRAAYRRFACPPGGFGRPGGLRGRQARTGGAQEGVFLPGGSPLPMRRAGPAWYLPGRLGYPCFALRRRPGAGPGRLPCWGMARNGGSARRRPGQYSSRRCALPSAGRRNWAAN